MKTYLELLAKLALTAGVGFSLSACTTMSNMMNPFYESPKPVALLGEKNDHAINGQRDKIDTARAALEARASYERAHTAQPVYPVMQPAMVRLMWVPDHINQHGDLVPAHYYYLKVLDDRWAVTDAFELEAQLNASQGAGSDLPFVAADEKLR